MTKVLIKYSNQTDGESPVEGFAVYDKAWFEEHLNKAAALFEFYSWVEYCRAAKGKRKYGEDQTSMYRGTLNPDPLYFGNSNFIYYTDWQSYIDCFDQQEPEAKALKAIEEAFPEGNGSVLLLEDEHFKAVPKLGGSNTFLFGHKVSVKGSNCVVFGENVNLPDEDNLVYVDPDFVTPYSVHAFEQWVEVTFGEEVPEHIENLSKMLAV